MRNDQEATGPCPAGGAHVWIGSADHGGWPVCEHCGAVQGVDDRQTTVRACETCRHWDPPVDRPGLHECLSAEARESVGGRLVATFRHEGCGFHDC